MSSLFGGDIRLLFALGDIAVVRLVKEMSRQMSSGIPPAVGRRILVWGGNQANMMSMTCVDRVSRKGISFLQPSYIQTGRD